MVADVLRDDLERGEVHVALTWHSDREAVLSVTDDGAGIPDHIDPTNAGTLGLQLVNILTRQIGDKRSRDLLLTGRIIEAAEAKEFGMVSEIVPGEHLLDRANELANDLIAASPSSLTRAKHLLTSAAAAALDHDLERAILENARIRCTPDFKEGVASFLEKRKPVWQQKPE